MRQVVVIAGAILAGAAGPRSMSLRVTPDPLAVAAPSRPAPVAAAPGPVFEPAPLPNADIGAPDNSDSGSGTQFSPMLLHRRDAFRGDGFSPGSTVESNENRNLQPGAGFRLSMPLQPQPPQ